MENELDLKICATESDVPSGAPDKDQIILVGGESDGVPIGGTSGQILAKQSAADFDTEWIDPPSGGGSAADISYDNTESGVEAENVQEAIDELAISLGDIDAALSAILGG